MYKINVIVIACFLFSATAWAQTPVANSLEISAQSTLGIFTADYKLTGREYGAEVIYHMATGPNSKNWMQSLHLKSIDAIVNYKNMQLVRQEENPRTDLFGDSYSVLAGLNISLAKYKYAELLVSPAFGLTYTGKTYFSNGNPIISSHLNFASRINLKILSALTQRTALTAGVDVLHYSNAAFRVPNNGMNAFSATVGIVHALGTPNTKKQVVKETDSSYSKHSIDIGINIGQRGVFRSKEGIVKAGLYTGYNYRISEVLALGTGLDAVYVRTPFSLADYAYTHQSYGSSYDHFRLGAAIGPDLIMGRLTVMAKYGYYLHYNSFRNNHTYWTAGLKYRVIDWLAVQSKIYLHKTEADFAGFGILFTPLHF